MRNRKGRALVTVVLSQAVREHQVGRREMVMRKVFVVLVGMLVMSGVLLGGPTRSAHAQGTLYDDFSGGLLDPDKWFGSRFTLRGGNSVETIRLVVNGQLLMADVVRGGTKSDKGRGASRNRLLFHQNPNAITAVKFDLRAQAFIQGCQVAGSSTSAASAGLIAFLFNDGGTPSQAPDPTAAGELSSLLSSLQKSAAPGADLTGDVGVFLQVVGTSASSGFRAHGTVFRCNSSKCTTDFTTIGVADLGPVPELSTATLRMSWDAASKRIDFQKDADPVQSVTYTQDSSRPPNLTLKALEVRGAAANCTQGPRPFAVMIAIFDNVFVNP